MHPRFRLYTVGFSEFMFGFEKFLFSYLTTEIRDFERSEEIPLQLMVRCCFLFGFTFLFGMSLSDNRLLISDQNKIQLTGSLHHV